ncbi:hypothetical protein HZH66_009407 [Vespula vulgaris]|uniref:Uncharacterized protein n=1 Tax=Vespula vulgaris TaxID=7454 RepID=A0A834JPJ1_VESVU|nr:hypothetical protein HZH66_009407 [Vespula vulgaris]
MNGMLYTCGPGSLEIFMCGQYAPSNFIRSKRSRVFKEQSLAKMTTMTMTMTTMTTTTTTTTTRYLLDNIDWMCELIKQNMTLASLRNYSVILVTSNNKRKLCIIPMIHYEM